jgi:hypothetical protein
LLTEKIFAHHKIGLRLMIADSNIANEEVSWLIGTTSITHLDMSLLYHRQVLHGHAIL